MNLAQYVGKVVRTRALDGGAWRSWAYVAAVGHSLRLCPFGDFGGLEQPVEMPAADNCGEPITVIESTGEMADEDKRFVGLLDATLVLPPGEWRNGLTLEIPTVGLVQVSCREWRVLRIWRPGTRIEDIHHEFAVLNGAEGSLNSDKFAGQYPGWLLMGPREMGTTPAGGHAILCRLAQRKSHRGWTAPIEVAGRKIEMVPQWSVYRDMFKEKPVRVRTFGFESSKGEEEAE